ncbi:MAG TPA: hypothetical protein PLW81_14910 [Thiobacillaceae bacterium]|nr:hypothetical protein [Thiobacillaceae bacterium]
MDHAFVWMARLLYLGLFLFASGMYYRAWKIALGKDMRHVADWRGKRIPDAARWAPWIVAINVVAASMLVTVGLSVLIWGTAFVVWSGAAALVLWTYYFLLRVITQRANR